MLFTIITVCYNAESKIESTIQSVLGQNYKDFEYLIIDGESTDATLSIIHKYENDKTLRIYSEKDFGIYNAMNRGICRARGKYIYFLNAGDLFCDESILQRMAEVIQNDDCVYYGKVHYVDEQNINYYSEIASNMDEFGQKLGMEWMPCHQAIFAPRNIMARYYFDESYKIRADYAWIVDAYLDAVTFAGTDLIVAEFDTEGVSSDIKYREQFNVETAKIMKRFYQHQNTDDLAIKKMQIVCGERDFMVNKYMRVMQIADKWMKLSEKHIDIKCFFDKYHYQNVAVYGAGSLGQHFMNALDNIGICVVACIDKNAENIHIDRNMVVPEKFDELVDAVIITALVPKEEITQTMHIGERCPVIMLDELLQQCI